MDDEAYERAAEELYAALPREFVAVRARLVAAAKAAGDRELARAIGALRRPVAAAWLVNLLVRQAPEEITALLDLGVAMRHAQAKLSGTQLRTLSTQRQQVTRALATRAHALATAHGEQVSRDVLHQVSDTLQAALADVQLAEQVRAGRLTTPLSYSGFGPSGLSLVPPPRGAAPALPVPPSGPDPVQPGREPAEPAQPNRPLVDQQHAEQRRREQQERAERERAEREQARQEAADRVANAERSMAAAGRRALKARDARDRADRDLTRAQTRVAELEGLLADATRVQDRAQVRAAKARAAHRSAVARRQRAEADLDRATAALAVVDEGR